MSEPSFPLPPSADDAADDTTGRTPPGLRPEARLICAIVARDAAGPHSRERAESIEALVVQVRDWEWLVEFATLNKVASLVARALQGAAAVPAPVRAQLHQQSRTNFAEVLILRAELDRLVKILHDEGITILPYKGPALAEEVYPSVALREAGDLDILVSPDDVERTIEILTRLGYQGERPTDAASMRELLATGCEFEMWGHSGRICVEVHWELMPLSLGMPLNMSYVAERMTRVARGDYEVYALPPQTLALVLCAHAGVKHDWTSLRWLVDVALLLKRYPELDVRALLEEAERLDICESTASGLLAAYQLAGASVDPAVIAALRDVRSTAAEVAVIHGRLFRPEKNQVGFREWRAYLDALVPGTSGRSWWRYLRTVTAPRWQDYRTDDEQMRSDLGARIVRPWRLAKRHGARILGRLK